MRYTAIVVISLFIIAGCATKKQPVIEVKEEIKPEVVPPVHHYLWAFKPQINIRETNSPASPKIAELSDGDSVEVITNLDGWYQIKTGNQATGWVRSDLLGPKSLSAFSRAITFVDSLREAEKTEIYFDKNLYHKRIYISYPPSLYTTKSAVEERTRTLVDDFQARVYPGQVTARVLTPGSEEEYLTISANGKPNADPLLPVIPFGKISKVIPKYEEGIVLEYQTPPGISDEEMLRTARKLSAGYPLSYQKIEITFVNETDSDQPECRLYFVEDTGGEDYKFRPCP